MSLYPRKCFRCGKMFLSKSNRGKVLCSEECKKHNNVEKTMRYYKNRSEVEKHYHKIYDKWKRRIRKCEKNGLICNEGIGKLKGSVVELTKMNREIANLRKMGNIPQINGVPDYEFFDKIHYNILATYDRYLYELFNSVKNDI